MTTPLLTTKLHIPPARPDLVQRLRLIERLDEGLRLGCKLTLVSAPAGFGKTTLVSVWMWSKRAPGSFAWLSLNREDNDPARFWRYVVAALQTVDGSIGRTVQTALQSPEPPPLEPLTTALINDLTTTPAPIILVLDDYHLINAEPIHDSLNFLLDHLPPQLRLIITTRADPPLSLPRRRGRGELVEIRAADLRFTTAEVAEFLNTITRLDLPAEDVAALEGRTEGWIVGLRLAALSLQPLDPAGKHGFVAAFAGDDRYVVDYLVEEVLRQQPEELQTFLLRTSILDRLCGPLCDAVLAGIGESANQRANGPPTRPFADSPARPLADSQAVLEHLERANLFVVPLDGQRRWYRYHHLFADLLRNHLRQSTGAKEVAQLHLQASRWYEREGFIAESVSHALASSDLEYATALIERHAPRMILRSETALTLGWLRTLPEDVVRFSPSLCISRAWSELYAPSRSMRSSAELADRWVQDAERAWKARSRDTDEPAPRGRFTSDVAALRARLSWRRGDPPRETMKLARQALDCIPEDDLALRSVVLYVLGTTLDDRREAIRVLAEAREAGEASGNLHFAVLAAFVQAAFVCHGGRFRRAAAICRETLQSIVEPFEHEKEPLPIAGGLYVVLGSILLEWGDLEGANRALSKGMASIRLVGNIGPLGRQWGYESLVRLKRHRGDMAGALAAIEQMEHLEPEDESLAAAFRTRLWLAQAEHDPGCLAAAARWAEERQLELEEEAGYSVEQLTLARLLIAQHRASQRTPRQPDLQPLLQSLEKQSQIARELELGWRMIEILVLRAMALQALEDTREALSALGQALALAEPEGFVLIFADEGPPMARLLYQAVEHRIAPDYAGRILAAFPDSTLMPDGRSRDQRDKAKMIEPLTRRELEVLQLIAEGLSNHEIAQRLVISPGTVKAHTGHTYSKLGVKNRMQAVAKARALGVLPPA